MLKEKCFNNKKITNNYCVDKGLSNEKRTSCGLPPSTKYSRDLWQWSQHPCDGTVSDASVAGRDLFAENNVCINITKLL